MVENKRNPSFTVSREERGCVKTVLEWLVVVVVGGIAWVGAIWASVEAVRVLWHTVKTAFRRGRVS